MHYYLDGYNLLFRISHAEEDELQKQREALLKDLAVKCELLKLNATIVFDAAFSPGEATRTRTRHVEIVYTSKGESADRYILDELKAMPRVHQEMVATSDRDLAWHARRLGAQTVDSDTFIAWLESRYRNKMRKLNKKPKRSTLEPEGKTEGRKVVVPKPEPKRREPPSPKETPESCFGYYEETFQQRYEKLEKTQPKKEHKQQEQKQKKQTKEVAPMSEEERWLRLFTERLKNPPET